MNALKKILALATFAILLGSAANTALATEPAISSDESAFGETYFADEGHPGFGETDDLAAAIADIEPAAGEEDGAEELAKDWLNVEITPEAAPVKVPVNVENIIE